MLKQIQLLKKCSLIGSLIFLFSMFSNGVRAEEEEPKSVGESEGFKVMNAGETHGQLIYLTVVDVLEESPRYQSLNPLSIPVFEEMPLALTVTAGAITIQQQNLLSHVQLKSRARGTPNLDISGVAQGAKHPYLAKFPDESWVHMTLSSDHTVTIRPSTRKNAEEHYTDKQTAVVELKSDTEFNKIYAHHGFTLKKSEDKDAPPEEENIAATSEFGSIQHHRVGSKAANYAELAKALNTPERKVVRPNFAVPFYYYQKFINDNDNVKRAVREAVDDSLMNVAYFSDYRRMVLEGELNPESGKREGGLIKEFQKEENVVDEELVNTLLAIFDTQIDPNIPGNKPRKMKLRSSTNAEDLPNFNGAGLYTSESYKPLSKKKKYLKSVEERKDLIREALKVVWSSVWNLRAWDEREFFKIPHDDVKMGVQINPSFPDEDVDGVAITKNIVTAEDVAHIKGIDVDSVLGKPGVYIEAQRGDNHSVANPVPGVRPEKILVTYNPERPLDQSQYRIVITGKSNIADDLMSILPNDNPKPVMFDAEIKDMAYQSLKARAHFKPLLDPENDSFHLDLEFKVDKGDTGTRAVFVKQARPYIE